MQETLAASLPAALFSLTQKQRAFALEYMKCRNGKQAARAAGYKGNARVLETMASKLVRNGEVASAIAELTKPALEEAQVTTERVLNKLAYFAFAPIEFDKNGKIKIPIKDQISALKALGDHLGVFESSRRPEQKPEDLALIEGTERAQRVVDAIIERARGVK